MPATAVTEAIYRARAQGKEEVDALARSVDGLAVSEEKVTRATRGSEAGFARLQARLDPAVKAHQAYERTLEQVARYEAAGIGTAQQRATVIDLATQKYLTQTAALERAAAAEVKLNTAQMASINTAAAVNQRLGIRDDFGTAARAADVMAYGRALDDLKAKYNPLFAAGQQYKATLLEINQAARAGALSEKERVTAINATKAAFAGQVQAINAAGNAYTLAGRRAGGMSGSLTQLSFQINDIASGLAMGQSPFQILAQQGGQVFQVWQLNNNVFRELGALLRGFAAWIGPLGLVALGFTAAAAAAYGLYELLRDKGKTSEEILTEHSRLLNIVKDSYDKVTKSASNWFEQSKAVTQLQLLGQQIELRRKLAEAVGASLSKASEYTNLFEFFGGRERQVKEQFAPFEDAIMKLQQGFKAGAPNVREFMDEVARIALLNPALQKAGSELINSVGDASKFATALDQVKQMLDLIAGGKLPKRNGLGISTGPETNAYDDLIQRTKDHIDELQEEAKYAGMASDAVTRLKLQHDAERAAKKAGVQINQTYLDQLKDELAVANRLNEVSKIRADIEFNRKTAPLSPDDRSVAQQLKPIYGNDVESALRSSEAAAIRYNNTLQEVYDTGRETFRGIAQDIGNAKTGTEILAAATARLKQKFLDLAADQVFNLIFSKGATAGSFSLVKPGSGGLLGGTIIPGILHDGGLGKDAPSSGRYIHPAYFDDAPRFHDGKLPWGPGEMPAIIKPEEEVLTTSDPRHSWNGGGASGPKVSITYAPMIDAKGADAAAVARIERAQRKSEDTFKTRVLSTVSTYSQNTPGAFKK